VGVELWCVFLSQDKGVVAQYQSLHLLISQYVEFYPLLHIGKEGLATKAVLVIELQPWSYSNPCRRSVTATVPVCLIFNWSKGEFLWSWKDKCSRSCDGTEAEGKIQWVIRDEVYVVGGALIRKQTRMGRRDQVGNKFKKIKQT
jgi:hypothetical protein